MAPRAARLRLAGPRVAVPREALRRPASKEPAAPLEAATPDSVLHAMGNRAMSGMLLRQPAPTSTPPAAPGARPGQGPDAGGDAAQLKKLLTGEITAAKRESILQFCLQNGSRYDAMAEAWKKESGLPLDQSIKNLIGTPKDAARALAYLRFGRLRLADKLFIASIGAGTDNATLFRLLPEAKGSLASTAAEFAGSYSVEYSKDGEMPRKLGSNRIAGLLDDEFSGGDLVKAKSLLAFGSVRPIDQLRIAMLGGSDDECVTAIDGAARAYRGQGKNAAEKEYWQTYGTVLGDDAKVHFRGGDSEKHMKLLMGGTFSTKELVRLAVEGAGTSWARVWDALSNATPEELQQLKAEWDAKGEIYKLINEEWTTTEADKKRVGAMLGLSKDSPVDDRITAQGLEVSDAEGVAKAALADDAMEKAFATAWTTGDFRKRYTDDGRKRMAVVWGDAIATGSIKVKVGTAARLSSIDAVRRLLTAASTDEATKASIRDDRDTMGRLREVKGFDLIEELLAPSDPIQRRDWLKSKFDRDKSSLSEEGDEANAYKDEMRELDHAVAGVKDPKNPTKEELDKLNSLAGSAQAALGVYLQARDAVDAMAIQALSIAAGLLITFATGGAGAVIGAELLSMQMAGQIARVALANALAKTLAARVVKGDRLPLDGAEAAGIFATGMVEGAAMVVATPVATRMLSPAYLTATNDAARTAAAAAFAQTGPTVTRAVVENAGQAGMTAAFETSIKSGTWKNGIMDGLGKMGSSMLVASATGGATGGATEVLKVALFTKKAGKTGSSQGPAVDPAAPAPKAAIPAPAAIDAASAAAAAEGILTSAEAPWFRWMALAASMGEHEAAYRAAFVAARRKIVERTVGRLGAEWERLGVQPEIIGGSTLDEPMRVRFVPGGKAATGAAGAQVPADKHAAAVGLLSGELHADTKSNPYAAMDVTVGDGPLGPVRTPSAQGPKGKGGPAAPDGGPTLAWNIPPDLRVHMLKEPINVRMRSMNAPEVVAIVPDAKVAHFQWDGQTWSMKVNPKYLTGTHITQADFDQLIGLVAHEARHGFQDFQIARWRKMRMASGTLAPEKRHFAVPPDVESKATPMQPGDPYEQMAQDWHRSMYGADAVEREAILGRLDSATKELEMWSSVLSAFREDRKLTGRLQTGDFARRSGLEAQVNRRYAELVKADADYRGLPEEVDAYKYQAEYTSWARSGLDQRAHAAQVSAAQAQVDSANIRLVALQQEADLYAKRGVSGAEVINVQGELAKAKSDVAAAQKDLASLQSQSKTPAGR